MSSAARKSNRGGALADQRVRAVATRAGLIATARRFFADAGYHATGTNELVAATAMTRGALYHHFTDKQALFEAVFRELSSELNKAAGEAVRSLSGDTWNQLVRAFRAYLQLVAASAEFQRILLIDGPAVLGWKRWRELQSEEMGAGVITTLTMLMEQGVIPEAAPGPLATLIQAALNDAALSIAYAPDQRAASTELTEALMRILEGLRTRES